MVETAAEQLVAEARMPHLGVPTKHRLRINIEHWASGIQAIGADVAEGAARLCMKQIIAASTQAAETLAEMRAEGNRAAEASIGYHEQLAANEPPANDEQLAVPAANEQLAANEPPANIEQFAVNAPQDDQEPIADIAPDVEQQRTEGGARAAVARRNPAPAVNVPRRQRPMLCYVCRRPHPASDCEWLRGMEFEERCKYVDKNKMCTNCLAPKRGAHQCPVEHCKTSGPDVFHNLLLCSRGYLATAAKIHN